MQYPHYVKIRFGRHEPGDVDIPDIAGRTLNVLPKLEAIERLTTYFNDRDRREDQRPHAAWVFTFEGALLAQYQVIRDAAGRLSIARVFACEPITTGKWHGW